MKLRAIAIGIVLALLSPVFDWIAPPASATVETVNCSVSGAIDISDNVVTSRSNCVGNVVIPATVTRIGQNAFNGAVNVTGITFESGSRLESIGNNAFTTTGEMSAIEIPASVVIIEDFAFYGAKFADITFEDGSALTTIGNFAFSMMNHVTSLSLGRFVNSIGAHAFHYAQALNSITFAREAPETIGANAFDDLPAGATVHISYYATSFTIDGDGKWNGLVVSRGAAGLNCSVSGGATLEVNVIIKANNSCVGVLDIPPVMFSISPFAFKDATGITELSFWPNGILNTIGMHAFDGATALKKVDLPESLTDLGSSTFSGATSLTSIVIPSGITTVGPYDFYGATSLTTVSFGAGSNLTSIDIGAFQNATNLKNIYLPDSLTSIGTTAFRNTGFTEFVFPIGLTSLGEQAFGFVSTLKKIRFKGNAPTASFGTQFLHIDPTAVIYVPYGATGYTLDSEGKWLDYPVTTSAPCSTTGVVKITSNEVTGFDECFGDVVIPSGITSIAASAFDGWTGISSIKIPATVTSIGARAFYSSGYLSNIWFLGNAPATIGADAFGDLGGGLRINVPFGATGFSVDVDGKWSGYMLAEVINCGTSGYATAERKKMVQQFSCVGTLVIPRGVKSIDENAFYSATGITSVTIPSTVTSIKAGAFLDASALTDLTFLGNAPTIADGAFPSSPVAVHATAGKTGFTPTNDGHWSGFGSNVTLFQAAWSTAKPTVSGTTVATNSGANKLTAQKGLWFGSPIPTYSYQWYACTKAVTAARETIPTYCSAISGATSNKLALRMDKKGKFIAVAVTGGSTGTPSATWLSKTSAKVT